MSNAPSQQMGGRGQLRIPRISMQAMDMQRQQAVSGPVSMHPTYPQPSSPHRRQQPKSPRTQQQQQQASHRSMSVSPIQHGGQFVGTHGMPSPQQVHIVPPTLQEGRRPSPTKRASFDPQLEHDASPPVQEQRHPSPTKRKTIVVNPTSFDIAPRSQMVPLEQEIVSPRKSMMQQAQPLSPRKSVTMMPQSQPLSPRNSSMILLQSQPLSPRKSMMQQPAQPLSPTKSMRPQSPVLQGHADHSFSMYSEHSTPSSQQQNLPASGSYMNNKSMSISPAVHKTCFDDDNEKEDDDDSHAMPINRSTSMVPMASSVCFQENQSVLMPSTSHNYAINRSASFSPEARQQQVNQPGKFQVDINAGMSIFPRRTQKQRHLSSPARLQSGISRSISISPTQMNMEQQPQPRLSSVNLAAVQGVRPGSPPQLNRYLSTAAPRVSMVTPSRASSTFQPQQLHSTSSSKQMQLGRMSVEHGAASSSGTGRRLMNHEHHLSVTDIVLRSLAAIASAVAFCVMITNTVWINGQAISYSNIAGFSYLHICYYQLGLWEWELLCIFLLYARVLRKSLQNFAQGLHSQWF